MDSLFTFNSVGVCLNPTIIKRQTKEGYFAISTALYGDFWYSGIDCMFPTQGIGSGASIHGKAFRTEKEALTHATLRLKNYIRNYGKAPQLLSELDSVVPKCVQLSLF